MAITYEPIATTTVSGSSTTTVTFSSLAPGWNDMVIVIAGNTTNLTGAIRFNNDSSSIYSRIGIRGNGTTANSFQQTAMSFIPFDGSYSQPSQNVIIHINGWAYSGFNKTAIIRSNNAGAGLDQCLGMWQNTSVINRVDILSTGATPWLAGTVMSIYGIKAA